MQASILGTSLDSYVIDNDLLGAVMRTVRGIEVDDATLSLEVIREVTAGPGHFLGHEQTLAGMQRDYYYPDISDRSSIGDWEEQGATDARDRAKAKVRETLAGHYPDHIDAATDARIRERFDILLPRESMRPGSAQADRKDVT